MKISKGGGDHRPRSSSSKSDDDKAAFDRALKRAEATDAVADFRASVRGVGPLSLSPGDGQPRSMTTNLSHIVQRSAAALQHEAQDLKTHLGGANYADPAAFGTARQALGEAMTRLGELRQELMGNLDAHQPGSRMGQMEGMMQSMKTMSALMQDVQLSSFQGARDGALPNTRDIQGALPQLTRLMQELAQVRHSMERLQRHDTDKGPAAPPPVDGTGKLDN